MTWINLVWWKLVHGLILWISGLVVWVGGLVVFFHPKELGSEAWIYELWMSFHNEVKSFSLIEFTFTFEILQGQTRRNEWKFSRGIRWNAYSTRKTLNSMTVVCQINSSSVLFLVQLIQPVAYNRFSNVQFCWRTSIAVAVFCKKTTHQIGSQLPTSHINWFPSQICNFVLPFLMKCFVTSFLWKLNFTIMKISPDF